MPKHDGNDDKETEGTKPGHVKLKPPKAIKGPFVKHSDSSAKKLSTATTSTITTATMTTTATAQRTRKVKFAEPLTEQRLYDRTASPRAETETRFITTKEAPKLIQELEPPLSLVAQLDLAARKLNARQSSKVAEHQKSPNSTSTPPPSGAPTTTAVDTPTSGATSSPKKIANKDRRNGSQESQGEKDMSVKTLRSTKSIKSIMKPSSPKAKKDKKDKN